MNRAFHSSEKAKHTAKTMHTTAADRKRRERKDFPERDRAGTIGFRCVVDAQ
jgi:hypothetical protein